MKVEHVNKIRIQSNRNYTTFADFGLLHLCNSFLISFFGNMYNVIIHLRFLFFCFMKRKVNDENPFNGC